LISRDEDGNVRFWDVITGQERLSFDGFSFVAVGADGSTVIASSSDGDVKLLLAAESTEATIRDAEPNHQHFPNNR
jgi:WD40 repeat protein